MFSAVIHLNMHVFHLLKIKIIQHVIQHDHPKLPSNYYCILIMYFCDGWWVKGLFIK